MSEIDTNAVEHSEPRQLKALLDLARSRGKRDDYIPAGCASRIDLVRQLSVLCKDAAQSGDALLAAVCARSTPLAVLEGMKELAKSLAAMAATDPQRGAATMLYHAAIAAALGRHGENISSRSGRARYALYEDLATFMDGDPLGQVFRDAAERLAMEPPSGESA